MHSNQSIKAMPFVTVLFVLLALFITACSNKPNDDKKSDGDLKNISKSIVDMVDESQKKVPNSATKTNTDANAIADTKIAQVMVRNLYLEQQKIAMSGLSLTTIEQYKKALKHIDKKQWQQAKSLLDEISKAQPQLSGAHYNKAIIAKAQHKNIIALAEVNKAIKANELNLYAHHLKGQLLRLKGDFAGAEQSYLTALSIWPNYADVHVNMAVLLELYRGRLLDAHQYYKSYLILVPDDQLTKRYLAGLNIKIKRAGLVVPVVDAKAKPKGQSKAKTEVNIKAEALPEKGQ
jgi:tetratricopeptide (TPR) repeat protein